MSDTDSERLHTDDQRSQGDSICKSALDVEKEERLRY